MTGPISALPKLPWHKRHARLWMGATLFLGDLFSFTLTGLLLVTGHYILYGSWHTGSIESLIMLAMFSMIAFGLSGLYPGIGLSPVSELRNLSLTFSAITLALAGFSFFLPSLSDFPRLGLLLFWLANLFLLPVFRWGLRYSISRRPAWGEPVIIFGSDAHTDFVIQHLRIRRMLGFDPVLLIAENDFRPTSGELPYITLDRLLDNPGLLAGSGIRTALISTNNLSEPLRTRLLHLQGHIFERLIKIPEQHDLGSLGISALDLDGVFAYEVRQNLGNPPRRWFKRIFDLTLTITGGLLILPIIILLCLLVRQTSPGPILYKQTRVGKNGKRFEALKFRTMVANAEELLDKTLRETPNLLAEWQVTQKLKKDPRITPLGNILRKFSLDELPQLVNILRGEMSLVGPRPCLETQIEFYGDNYDLYTAVLPGLTGLWQVSGRNGTTYAERVRLDAYYVRNWSLWLDLYILFKTFWVVLKRDGAY